MHADRDNAKCWCSVGRPWFIAYWSKKVLAKSLADLPLSLRLERLRIQGGWKHGPPPSKSWAVFAIGFGS
jgi:hypothetical protein